jgi:hypothetical protein
MSISGLRAVDCRLPAGLVVRLLNATRDEIASATRRLGSLSSTDVSDASTPILSIEYVTQERPEKARAMPLGAGVALTVARGLPDTIISRRGPGRIPLLNVIVRLAALAHGVLPLHAAALGWKGKGVLIIGSAGSGKSGLFLGLTSLGGHWVDAEWVYVRAGSLHGARGAARIRETHIRQVPSLAQGISPLTRLRLGGLRGLGEATQRLQRSVPRSRPVISLASRVDRWSTVEIGPNASDSAPTAREGVATLDTVLAVRRSPGTRIWMEETDPDTVIDEVVKAQLETYRLAQSAYRRFHGAFPAERIEIFHDLDERLRTGLVSALAGHPVYVFHCPERYSLSELGRLADTAAGDQA